MILHKVSGIGGHIREMIITINTNTNILEEMNDIITEITTPGTTIAKELITISSITIELKITTKRVHIKGIVTSMYIRKDITTLNIIIMISTIIPLSMIIIVNTMIISSITKAKILLDLEITIVI